VFGKVPSAAPHLGKPRGTDKGCSGAATGGSWHQQQRGRSPRQICWSRGIAGRGWTSSTTRFSPRHPLMGSHGSPAARSTGANATLLLQPVVPTSRRGERAIAHLGAPCSGSGGKSRVLARGRGFGAASQGLCLVWFQCSLFNSNDWQRLGRMELFVKG